MSTKKMTNDTFTPIGRVIEAIVDQYRLSAGGGIVHLIRVWEAAVGSPIRDNAKPFAVNGALLLVHVSSSAWLHHLQFLKAELLERLNHGLAGQRIDDIKFKIGPM